jgi:predicted enzyme related to lactoylglutathione lyase
VFPEAAKSPTPVTVEPPRIGYFEIPAVEPERAAEFFLNVFGWRARRRSWSGGVYLSFPEARGEVGCGVVGGAAAGLTAPTPVVHVEETDLDRYLERVTGAGGEVIEAARQIDEHGRFARFKDSEGNLWGLWAPVDGRSQL